MSCHYVIIMSQVTMVIISHVIATMAPGPVMTLGYPMTLGYAMTLGPAMTVGHTRGGPPQGAVDY